MDREKEREREKNVGPLRTLQFIKYEIMVNIDTYLNMRRENKKKHTVEKGHECQLFCSHSSNFN